MKARTLRGSRRASVARSAALRSGAAMSAASRGLRAFWQLNSNLIEYVDHIGSFRNTTIEGKITGMELNLGILDDFVKGRAEASSRRARDATWHWFTDDFFTRFSKDSAFLTICTRWHIDDVIGRLKKQWPDMLILEFQAIAEKDEKFRKKGEALFPEHKPLDFLLGFVRTIRGSK